jgi:sortase A
MLARILGGVGRTLMTAGTLILLFVAYQLWGTGLLEARSQDELGDRFAEQLAEADAATGSTTTPSTAPATTTTVAGAAPISVVPGEVAPALPLPGVGDPVARIEIPKIGITRTVVEGITVSQLARGPGHYPESPLPGQAGNVSIAGHRTTYGQPFHNVDKLEPGDQILTTTVQGDFVYEVERLEIVEPTDVEVLEDKGDNRLTLIACHPKYSLAQRIIVHATLKGTAAPEIAGQAEAREKAENGDDGLAAEEATIDGGLSGRSASRTPAVLWGLAAAGVWLVTWLVQTLIRRRTRARTDGDPTRGQRLVSWTPYLVGVPVFLITLFVFFENFARFLPANY